MFKLVLILLLVFPINGLFAKEGFYIELNAAGSSDNSGLGNKRKAGLVNYGSDLTTVDENNNLPSLYELQKDGGSVGITVGLIKKLNYFKNVDYWGIEANYTLSRIIGEQDQRNMVDTGLDGRSSNGACQGTHYAKDWLKNYQMLNFILGKKINDRVDIFVKAGPAMGKTEKYFGTTWTGGACGAVEGSDKSTEIGYNIGLDGVYSITKNIGLKLGYNFIDLQKSTVFGTGKLGISAQSRANDLEYSFDNVYHNYVFAIKFYLN
jgi:opacity protein-like surface antigen